jgi:hypothetical protein
VGVIGGYVFPHVCSRCAREKATRLWRMKTPDIPGLKLINQNERWVRTYALDVPVCTGCGESLERAALARVATLILCALLGLGISSWILQLIVGDTVNGLLFFVWVFAGTILGLAFGALAALPAIDYYLKGQVGRIFNGGRGVRFYNRAYQQLFNRMNRSQGRQPRVHHSGAQP